LDGLNSHCVIIDELHAIKDRNLYEVMKQSMSARRQPLLVMITTAGTIRECIYDDMYDYACKVVDGIIEDDRFLPVLYELDSRDEWTDWRMWQKANPGLGTIKKLEDLVEKVERAKANPKDLPGLLTKDFNIRETTSGSWLTFEEINNTETFDMEELKGSYAVGGVDLSSTTDLTCATLLIMKPGSDKKYCIQQYFLPEEGLEQRVIEDKIPYDKWRDRGLLTVTPGNKIDYHMVTEWFLKMLNEYDIHPLWIGYDPWNAQYWIKEMEEYGFTMVEVRQGYKTLSQPMKELEADLKAHKINYGNNPILKWCLTNVQVKRDENDNIRPVKGQNKRQRIDGAVSLLIAYTVLFNNMQDYQAMI
jgi:phage terminase large subunit-like protein